MTPRQQQQIISEQLDVARVLIARHPFIVEDVLTMLAERLRRRFGWCISLDFCTIDYAEVASDGFSFNRAFSDSDF